MTLIREPLVMDDKSNDRPVSGPTKTTEVISIMRLKKTRLVAVVAVIGALAAGGAAYTAGNTIPDSTAGYGTSNITGATAQDLRYTLNSDGTVITGATLVFQGDLWDGNVTPAVADTVKAGFGSDDLTDCTVDNYDNTASTTTAYCGDVAGHAGTAFTQLTNGSTTFHVAVEGGSKIS
jgi:hypothetical protein